MNAGASVVFSEQQGHRCNAKHSDGVAGGLDVPCWTHIAWELSEALKILAPEQIIVVAQVKDELSETDCKHTVRETIQRVVDPELAKRFPIPFWMPLAAVASTFLPNRSAGVCNYDPRLPDRLTSRSTNQALTKRTSFAVYVVE